MRHVLAIAVVVVAVGCSKSKTEKPAPEATPTSPPATATAPAPAPAPASSPACEAAREQYLAWSADRVEGAIATESEEMKAELQAEANKEMQRAREAFVPACVAMGAALDTTCFEVKRSLDRDADHDRKCREVVAELERRMFAR